MGTFEYKRLPQWEMKLVYLRQRIEEAFPKDYFYDSKWASWVKRIKLGHDDEKEAIERIHRHAMDSLNSSPNRNPHYDPNEVAGEDYGRTCELTVTMYAALVVGIWSDVEMLMKSLVPIAYEGSGKRDEALRAAKDFCEARLDYKAASVNLKDVVKGFRELEVPWKWEDICSAFNRHVKIQIGSCRQYKTINAIRVMNNAFKHENGRYREEPGKEIDPTLLASWDILDNHNQIDYSKLSIEELVRACSDFFTDLLEKMDLVFDSLPKPP